MMSHLKSGRDPLFCFDSDTVIQSDAGSLRLSILIFVCSMPALVLDQKARKKWKAIPFPYVRR